MSAIEKAAAMLREEAEAIKASHTLRGDWCGDPTEADYHEMIAAADAAIAERDALRAKIEQMEKQRDGLLGALRVIAARPARDEGRNNWEAIVWESISFAEEAIALCDEPDVHPAPSIPDDVMRDAKRYRFLRAAKNIPISTEAARDPVVYDAAIDAAMLARAPEAAP